MRFFFIIILTALLFALCPVMAQGVDPVGKDSLFSSVESLDSLDVKNDSIENVPVESIQSSGVAEKKVLPGKKAKNNKEASSSKPKEFRPDPTKAIIYSAIFPGLGQIYNRKYWKLPIVYGGFMGCVYAITWNGNQYNDYKQAYRDITDNDPNTHSWWNYLKYGVDPASLSPSEMSWYTSAFKNRKDFYRRNRDLSYIVTVGVYALCMLDAYVDAQLFDFDISPNLSMRVEPVIYNKSDLNSRSLGLQCSIKF